MRDPIVDFVNDLSIPAALIFAFLVMAVWAVIGAVLKDKARSVSIAAAIVGLAAILTITLFSRSKTEVNYYLIPFSTLQRAKDYPHLYGCSVLNMIMFMPLGLSLPFILRGNTAKRVLLTILTGFLLSLVIEILQFVLSLGFADVDDIITNTTGTAFGSLSYPLSRLFIKAAEAKKK